MTYDEAFTVAKPHVAGNPSPHVDYRGLPSDGRETSGGWLEYFEFRPDAGTG